MSLGVIPSVSCTLTSKPWPFLWRVMLVCVHVVCQFYNGVHCTEESPRRTKQPLSDDVGVCSSPHMYMAHSHTHTHTLVATRLFTRWTCLPHVCALSDWHTCQCASPPLLVPHRWSVCLHCFAVDTPLVFITPANAILVVVPMSVKCCWPDAHMKTDHTCTCILKSFQNCV